MFLFERFILISMSDR